MKGLNRSSSTNRYRFASFAERIAAIDVDVGRREKQEYEVAERPSSVRAMEARYCCPLVVGCGALRVCMRRQLKGSGRLTIVAFTHKDIHASSLCAVVLCRVKKGASSWTSSIGGRRSTCRVPFANSRGTCGGSANRWHRLCFIRKKLLRCCCESCRNRGESRPRHCCHCWGRWRGTSAMSCFRTFA